MADLDAELLALAGGDDSSDEGSSAPAKQKQSSPEASTKDHQHSQGSPDTARKGVARPVKRRKRMETDGEEEEGELSSSSVLSRNSRRSASMSEFESDASPPPEDNQGPIFPYEKVFYSAEDKEKIMAMPEIQREEILSERAQQVDRHNQDIALRRLLASREREEARSAHKNKRKVSGADLEDSQRKSSRKKTTLGGRKVGEPSDAIEAYKRQREQKGKRDEQRRRDASSRKGDSTRDSPVRAADYHDESEVEWDEGDRRRSPSIPKDDPPAEIQDIQRARVGRSNFAQVCFYPGFEQAISNCYARVVIGPNPKTGNNEYRVCLIKRFAEGRPYALEGPNGRNFITTQYAVLAHGKAEREFPFIACSDSPITEAEFNRYRQTMIVEDCKMATKSMIAEKVSDINRLLNHQFTKDELEEKLRRQGTNDNKSLIFERIQLEKRRTAALAAHDDAAVSECDAELSQLNGPKLAFGTTLVKPRSTEKSQQERLAELNLRNQKLNTENVRKAQLAERKAAKVAAAAVARGDAVANRFARVKTRARTHYDVNSGHLVAVKTDEASDRSRSMTPMAGTPTSNKANTSTPSVTTPSKAAAKPVTGVPVIRHRPTDEDNIAALDFDIDIEL